MTLKTTDLCDEFANELSVCKQEFQSFGKITAFSGPISTVRVLEDNVLVKAALQTILKGHVLVVDGGGSKNCALMGDNLAAIAIERELAGVIIYGCVRDTADLANMDIGVLALGKNPLKSEKKGEGETDIAVTFGDVEWKPGSYVYVDEDGVVVSKRELSLN
ncbi:ribonuclease E activity regulator RraA [Lentibacillus sp. N15]|uniref:ribonuclease E activity regulator RraA n=1 Tax=Lentibacillus songyuanensis TaxID=3136161 RepID=UPI0031BB15BC